MFKARNLLLASGTVLLSACAAHQSTPDVSAKTSSTPVAATPAKAPAAPAPLAKPKKAAVENNRPAAAKNEALAAREVGYYLDVLQGRLQQQLDPGVIVGRERDSIVLDFSRRLSFASESAQLETVDRNLLEPLARILGEYRATLVSVRVSAEEDAAVARKLALERATAVARKLTEAGVSAARMVVVVPSAPARNGNSHVEIVLAAETRQD